jgi:hypothetical protein
MGAEFQKQLARSYFPKSNLTVVVSASDTFLVGRQSQSADPVPLALEMASFLS